jgi:hypothetical protein
VAFVVPAAGVCAGYVCKCLCIYDRHQHCNNRTVAPSVAASRWRARQAWQLTSTVGKGHCAHERARPGSLGRHARGWVPVCATVPSGAQKPWRPKPWHRHLCSALSRAQQKQTKLCKQVAAQGPLHARHRIGQPCMSILLTVETGVCPLVIGDKSK